MEFIPSSLVSMPAGLITNNSYNASSGKLILDIPLPALGEKLKFVLF
jgi:hypothetical protein